MAWCYTGNLKSEIDSVSNPNLKRKMALAFIENYSSALSTFMSENGYELRQIEALNEIASNEEGEDSLRASWWRDVIGNNPENKDAYFIDVLKILKKQFPNTELIYNEYDEFLPSKADKIVEIIEQIKKVEERDGKTLLDGIGLQAHYSDYVEGPNIDLKPEYIIESAIKLQKACGEKRIYITEYDFIEPKKRGTKPILEQTFLDTFLKISNGFIAWGNSDKLTWFRCIDKDGKYMNAHIIDSNGKPKEIYDRLKEIFFGPRSKEQSDRQISGQEVGKFTSQSYSQNVEQGDEVIKAVEKGVILQKQMEEGKTQGDG